MPVIEKNISNFIETQFPEVYRDEGPLFVEFVKKYYEWLEESNNATYHSRNLLNYKDIDETVDNFVVKFKEKYLKEIQLDTVGQTRQLVKHSLDLYRAKGTERAVDLFFRAVFGKPASVYYPGDDIFRLSDGKWVQPKYLEVSPSDYNNIFVGKQIQGVTSGATAYVERYIKRKIKSKYINVLYISVINGNFETGELITIFGQKLKNLPTVIGSLTTLDIVVGGESFNVGDIVSIESNNGVQAKGRVTNVASVTGLVDFNLIDSGWGYSSEAEFIVSEKVLTLDNVIPTETNTTNTAFKIFETLKQPLANVVIVDANATFVPATGSELFTYSNNVLIGKGRVIEFTASNSISGEVYVSETYGNLAPITEVNANLSGTISVSNTITPLIGLGTVNTTSNVVEGNGTSFNTALAVGAAVRFFAYNSNGVLVGDTTRIVSTISNATHIIVSSNLSFTSNATQMQLVRPKVVVGTSTSFNTQLAYGNRIAIFSNSSNYIIRTVNAIANSTYMTVQEDITFSNTTANYANTTTNFKIYTEANTIAANISSYNDKSQLANVMSIGANIIFTVSDMTIPFSNGQIVYMNNANNVEIANATIRFVTNVIGVNGLVYAANTRGVFQPNTALPLRIRNSNGSSNTATANLKSYSIDIGVFNINTAFSAANSNYVIASNSLTSATISKISSGIFANAGFSSTLTFPESVTLIVEPLTDFVDVKLNAVAYGFRSNTFANASTQYLEDIFLNKTINIGGIGSLININPGKDYDTPPFVIVNDPFISPYDRKDYNFTLKNATSVFTTGEIVTQDNGATGIIRFANLTNASVKRIEFNNNFDDTLALTGESSGSVANISLIEIDKNVLQIGLNAFIQANVQTGNGSVSSMNVYDSGFGFLNDENATFTSNDGTRSGTVRINLGKQGFSEGFYKNRKGFLSDGKKLFDGEYYQEYSYEIRSSVTSDKYADMLKKVLHVAGTKAFYNVVFVDTANTHTTIKSSIVKTA